MNNSNKRKYSVAKDSDDGISLGSSHSSDAEDYTYESYSDSTEIIDLCTPSPSPPREVRCPPAPLRREKKSGNLLPREVVQDDAADYAEADEITRALLTEEENRQWERAQLECSQYPDWQPISQESAPLDLGTPVPIAEPVPTLVVPHPETEVEVCGECLFRMINQCRYPTVVTQERLGSMFNAYRLTFEVMRVPCGHPNRRPWTNDARI